MSLTKAILARKLAKDYKIPQREAEKFIALLFETICQSLEKGQNIKLSGFGNFELRDKTSRPGRNPKTGDVIPVSPRRVVTFHAGQKLRAQVKQKYHRNADKYTQSD